MYKFNIVCARLCRQDGAGRLDREGVQVPVHQVREPVEHGGLQRDLQVPHNQEGFRRRVQVAAQLRRARRHRVHDGLLARWPSLFEPRASSVARLP